MSSVAADRFFYVDGKFQLPLKSRKTMPVVNPATESAIFELPLGDQHDVDAAVAAAKKAFPAYSCSPLADRIALMKRIVEEYKRR